MRRHNFHKLTSLCSAILTSAAALVWVSVPPLASAADVTASPSQGPVESASIPVHATFSEAGLTSLKAGDAELLTDGDLEMNDLQIAGNGVGAEDFSPTKGAFDPESKTLARFYRWGSIRAVYREGTGKLDIDLSITNTGDKPLTRLGITVMQIAFPEVPEGIDWANRYLRSCDRADEIPVIMADWHTAHLALCNTDPNQFTKFGFNPNGDKPYDIWVEFDDAPIEPGTTRQTKLALYIGGGDKPWDSVREPLRRYAEKYPFELNWSDHRPIGSAFLATSQKGYPKNPRGWLLDPDIDTTTPEGRAQFKIKMMAYADSVIAHCKTMNAQGIIIWDLEGQEMPHATSYLADPRMLPKVAPEMDEIADEFFKKFSDAGLRTGLTVRPTRVGPADNGAPGWKQQDVTDQPSEIDQKISYAEKRWGCTLIYVDSNVDFVKDSTGKVLSDPAMPAADFQKLARAHKNCLLIPEHKSGRYWAYTAPYAELRLGFDSTPPGVLEAYPHAFTVLRVVDGPSLTDPDVVAKLTASVKRGDILLFRPWWDDPQTTDIQHIYQSGVSVPQS